MPPKYLCQIHIVYGGISRAYGADAGGQSEECRKRGEETDRNDQKPFPPAPRTPRGTGPKDISSICDELDIEIKIQYQRGSPWCITEKVRLPRSKATSVIPSLCLQFILTRKKTYATNGGILGSRLGRIR